MYISLISNFLDDKEIKSLTDWGPPNRNLDHLQRMNADQQWGRNKTEMQSKSTSTLRGTRIPVPVFGTTVSRNSAIWRHLHAGQH